jgi:wobble nucleotide-excising tRNase
LGIPTLQALLDVVDVTPSRAWLVVTPKQSLGARQSVVFWIQSGSHFPHDDEYSSVDDTAIENYLNVFKKIFIETKHEAHYEMMMR